MNSQEFPPHGGNVYLFAKSLGISPFGIIDLSSSVNPLIKDFLKITPEVLLNLLEFYPDPEGHELKEIIAKRYRINKNNILLGNGSYELLQLLLLNLPNETNLFIPEPTFIGYKKILSLRKDIRIHTHFSLDPNKHLKAIETFLTKTPSPKAVIICNPNNPTGTLFRKKDLKDLISFYDQSFFILDEAFIDFVEEESLISEVEFFSNLFILRSFTKFYGLAGARIGYMVSSHPHLKKIKELRPPWSVNTLSQYLAKELFLNEAFREKSLKHFRHLRNLFEDSLREIEVNFIPSFTNFYLLKDLPSGREFFFWLLKERLILIRSCYNFYGLTEKDFRVSLKDEDSLRLFIEALREWLKAL